jgi:hypothetical protein
MFCAWKVILSIVLLRNKLPQLCLSVTQMFLFKILIENCSLKTHHRNIIENMQKCQQIFLK